MKRKNKLLTGIILLATIVLAGIAVFSAIRIYQLRNQPISPAQPSSQPEAAVNNTSEISSNLGNNANFYCRAANKYITIAPVASTFIFDGTKNKWVLKVTYKASDITDESHTDVVLRMGTASCYCGGGSGQAPGDEACNLNCIVNNDPTTSTLDLGWPNVPDEYQTVVNMSAKGTETFDIIREVDNNCGSFQTDVYAISVNGATSCTGSRDAYTTHHTNVDCPEETITPIPTTTPTSTPDVGSCANLTFSLTTSTVTPTATSTSVATATPTATPTATSTSVSTPGVTGTPAPTLASCNNTCDSSSDCKSGLSCSEGVCRNPSCADQSNCKCLVAQKTTEPSMPNAGISFPTIAGIGSGLLLLIISPALAL